MQQYDSFYMNRGMIVHGIAGSNFYSSLWRVQAIQSISCSQNCTVILGLTQILMLVHYSLFFNYNNTVSLQECDVCGTEV